MGIGIGNNKMTGVVIEIHLENDKVCKYSWQLLHVKFIHLKMLALNVVLVANVIIMCFCSSVVLWLLKINALQH